MANPNTVPAPIRASFLKEDGSTVVRNLTLPPTSRTTIKVNDIAGLEQAALSTVVESHNGLTLVVERTMFWDRVGPYYGGHTERAGEGARRQWFFAEGSQGFFDTYLLLANPQPTPNTATVSFLTEARGVVLANVSRFRRRRGPRSTPARRSHGARSASRSASRDVRAAGGRRARDVLSARVAVLEWRARLGGRRCAATNWYHAEGATGPYFDTYILVANPNPSPATVTFTFLLDTGVVITRIKTIAGQQPLDGQRRRRGSAAGQRGRVDAGHLGCAGRVGARDVLAGGFTSWFEAHNSFGLTAIGPKWGMAEGRVGGPRGFETYILLANPNATAANGDDHVPADGRHHGRQDLHRAADEPLQRVGQWSCRSW